MPSWHHIERETRMDKQTRIEISEETCQRLEELSRRTGRSITQILIEAIETHLEDLEDIALAEQTLERIRRGEESVLSAEQVWREMGLEDD